MQDELSNRRVGPRILAALASVGGTGVSPVCRPARRRSPRPTSARATSVPLFSPVQKNIPYSFWPTSRRAPETPWMAGLVAFFPECCPMASPSSANELVPDPRADAELGHCAWFVWDLRRSGLVERDKADPVLNTFLQSNPEAEPPHLAAFLVRENILTS